MKRLFLFTIGPVQSFIAQARRTRDLYAGSQILSQLTREAMMEFERQFPEAKIIYPVFDFNDKSPSLPNRFIARLNADRGVLEEKGGFIETVVRRKWMDFAHKALAKAGVQNKLNKNQHRIFEEQISCALEVYWLFVDFSDSYRVAYEKLERFGGAIKNLRPFEQFVQEGARKCSLDGVNNALFYSASSEQRPAYLEKAIKVPGFSLGKTEGLGAVGFTKRFYAANGLVDQFPSTAGIALLENISQLDEKQTTALQIFRDLFDQHKRVDACLRMQKVYDKKFECTYTNWHTDYDDYFLFEENLSVRRKEIIADDQRELLSFLQGKFKFSLKTRYYAVILFDGDRMGQWLSGENLKEGVDLEEFHSTLSKALASFAKWARSYLTLEKGNGHAVYAGGDDFLGFVNLHHLFDVMKELRTQFDFQVDQVIKPFKREESRLTFSAGIVIAHYKTPFSEVLKKAREMEKQAKEYGDRNAFGITVVKHSGEIQKAIYKWDKDANNSSGLSNWEALEEVYLKMKADPLGGEGFFSNTFIQSLTEELSSLSGIQMRALSRKVRKLQLIELEIGRLIERSWQEGKRKDEKEIESMLKAVETLWTESFSQKVKYPPSNFVHALHIVDFMSRKIEGRR